MDRQKTPQQLTFCQAVLLLAILALVMLWWVAIVKIRTGISMLYAAIICSLVGVALGRSWENMFANVLSMINKALPSMLILLIAGLINASWIASGTIPLLIYYGLQLLSAKSFLVVAFALCALISMITGSSWATVSSFGLALIGIAKGLAVPLPLAAGAIVSGSFLGGKWSPLSDSLNLAAAIIRRKSAEICQHMLKSTGPAVVVSAVLYALLGLFSPGRGQAVFENDIQSLVNVINLNFNLNLLLLLPIGVVLVLGAMRFHIIPVLMAGVGSALLEAAWFQGQDFLGLSEILWSGYVSHTGNAMVDTLLSRGGLTSMTDLLLLLLCAFVFAGILEEIGLLVAIMKRLLRTINNKPLLIVSTAATTMVGVCLSSSEYVSMIINARLYGPIYKKLNVDSLDLAHIVTEVAVYMGALVPWSAGAVLSAATLGVATAEYLPYVFVAWLNIMFTCIGGFAAKPIGAKKKTMRANVMQN